MSSATLDGSPPRARGHTSPARRVLSLIFDDGPDPTWTPLVLDQLEQHRARATFFVVGERVLSYPDVARQVFVAGHNIQLHCHRHIRHTELTETELADDTATALQALVALGVYYLPPAQLEDAIGWIKTQLGYGASVIAVSWRGEGRDEPFTGDQVHDRLAADLAAWHTLDARTDDYRLDRFNSR